MQTFTYYGKATGDKLLSLLILIPVIPILLILFSVSAICLKEFPLYSESRGLTLSSGIFRIYKIKTMKRNKKVNEKDIFLKPALYSFSTPFCRWMRRTGMDELPQIFNVLKGDMSLVGPRPLNISDLRLLKKNAPEDYNVRKLISVKPGITGLWQIFGNREQGTKNLIFLDVLYNKQVSFKIDMKITVATLILLLKGHKTDSMVCEQKG